MSDYTQAIRDVRFLAARFQGILSLADALEKVGSIENAGAEAQARLKALQDQITAETERLSQKIAAAHQEAQAITSKAQEDANVIKIAANTEDRKTRDRADEYLKGRSVQAQALTTAANAHHQERTEHAAELVGKAGADAQVIKDDVVSHRAELDKLYHQVVQAKNEFEAVQKQIEQAKRDRQNLRDAVSSLHKNIAGA